MFRMIKTLRRNGFSTADGIYYGNSTAAYRAIRDWLTSTSPSLFARVRFATLSYLQNRRTSFGNYAKYYFNLK